MKELFEGIDGIELNEEQQTAFNANVEKHNATIIEGATPNITAAATKGMLDQAAVDTIVGNRIGEVYGKVEAITGIKKFDELQNYADGYAKNDVELKKNFDDLTAEKAAWGIEKDTLTKQANSSAQQVSLLGAGVNQKHISDISLLASARMTDEKNFDAVITEMKESTDYKHYFTAAGINAGGGGKGKGSGSGKDTAKTLTGMSKEAENKTRAAMGLPPIE